MPEPRKTAPGEQVWLGLRLGGDADGCELEELAGEEGDGFLDLEGYDYLGGGEEGNDGCLAKGLDICCRLSAHPLVRCAVDVAYSIDRAIGRAAAGDSSAAAAELTRVLAAVSGLLAQVHAVVPGISRMDAVRLLCPLGSVSAALNQFGGCPWAPGHPEGVPGRRAELEPLGGLLQECAAAVQQAAGFSRRPRWGW